MKAAEKTEQVMAALEELAVESDLKLLKDATRSYDGDGIIRGTCLADWAEGIAKFLLSTGENRRLPYFGVDGMSENEAKWFERRASSLAIYFLWRGGGVESVEALIGRGMWDYVDGGSTLKDVMVSTLWRYGIFLPPDLSEFLDAREELYAANG